MGPGQDPYGALRARARALMGPGQDPYGALRALIGPKGQDPYGPGPGPLWALWARARALIMKHIHILIF